MEKENTGLGRRRLKTGWTCGDLLAAAQRAVYEAVQRHKERGEPIVVWEEGAVKWLVAEEIELDRFHVASIKGEANESGDA